MIRSVLTSWNTVAVLTMIFIQIISGSLCSTPLENRTFVPPGVATFVQERGSPVDNRKLLLSEADHHVRCEQRSLQAELYDFRFSEGLRYSVSADLLRESQIYLISRPPKYLS